MDKHMNPQHTQVNVVFRSGEAHHRRYRRARLEDVFVRFRVGDQTVLAKVVDVSEGGAFVRAKHTVPVGAFLELTLVQAGHDECVLHGIVIDDVAKRAGMALRFTALSDPARAAVGRLLAETPDTPEVHNTLEVTTPTDVSTAKGVEELRQQIRALEQENRALRERAQWADQAEAVIGRLQLEVERARERGKHADGLSVVDVHALRADAEGAYLAMRAVLDKLDKTR
jgi:DNA-binding transcriptional ArsR family regulator